MASRVALGLTRAGYRGPRLSITGGCRTLYTEQRQRVQLILEDGKTFDGYVIFRNRQHGRRQFGNGLRLV